MNLEQDECENGYGRQANRLRDEWSGAQCGDKQMVTRHIEDVGHAVGDDEAPEKSVPVVVENEYPGRHEIERHPEKVSEYEARHRRHARKNGDAENQIAETRVKKANGDETYELPTRGPIGE
jgi:hypothetical protein